MAPTSSLPTLARQQDFFLTTPDSILQHVFTFLDAQSTCAATEVSMRWSSGKNRYISSSKEMVMRMSPAFLEKASAVELYFCGLRENHRNFRSFVFEPTKDIALDKRLMTALCAVKLRELYIGNLFPRALEILALAFKTSSFAPAKLELPFPPTNHVRLNHICFPSISSRAVVQLTFTLRGKDVSSKRANELAKNFPSLTSLVIRCPEDRQSKISIGTLFDALPALKSIEFKQAGPKLARPLTPQERIAFLQNISTEPTAIPKFLSLVTCKLTPGMKSMELVRTAVKT